MSCGRRTFLASAATLLAAGPLEIGAQPDRPRLVGIVADPPQVRIIAEGLGRLGWTDGANVRVLSKSPEGRLDLARIAIAEFVGVPVDVLVVFTDAAASLAVKATYSIPIVMLTTGAVVEDGLIASLARPDRNLTGLSFDAPREITGKRLELLKAMAPKVARVAFLIELVGAGPRGEHEGRATTPETKFAAHALGVSVVPVVFKSSPEGLARALNESLRSGADALLVSEGVLVTLPEHQRRIHEFAVRQKLPALHSVVRAADSGGLMAYGLDFPSFVARIPHFIDRILRGAKPSELPIEQPLRLDLVVNANTARALGLAIPPSIRLQASRVIE